DLVVVLLQQRERVHGSSSSSMTRRSVAREVPPGTMLHPSSRVWGRLPGAIPPRDDALAEGVERESGDPATAPWSGLLLPRSDRSAGDRRRHDPADPRPRDPSGVDGRLDLPRSPRTPAGVGDRGPRKALVPGPQTVGVH